MSIFKKKQKSIYNSQPQIDFNDNSTDPIVHSDQTTVNSVPPGASPFQKVTFDHTAEPQKTIDVNSNTIVITTGFVPDSYNDAPNMADLLLEKGQLIVHLEKLPKPERVRLLDFMSGVMYAFNGHVQKIEHKTYQFTVQKNAE